MKHCDICHPVPGLCSRHQNGCPACIVQISERIASLLAHRRVNGQVYMDGRHNPLPSELLDARRTAQEILHLIFIEEPTSDQPHD